MIADVRDPDRARVRQFEEVLATNFRTELLNRKWVEGMKGHGYAGAGHMAELVKNAFRWSVTRPGSVTQQMWDDLHAVYVKDKLNVGMREFFETENPHARQDILATLLEANRIGAWKADEATLCDLAREYAASVAKHGDSAGLVSGGNVKLEKQVVAALTAPGDPDLTATAAAYRAALTKSSGVDPTVRDAATAREIAALSAQASQAKPELVAGEELTGTTADAGPPAAEPGGRAATWAAVAGGGAVLVLLYGVLRRKGAV